MGFPESMFVDTVTKDWQCPICLDVFCEPVAPCGHSFCKPCLEMHLQITPQCPFKCNYPFLLSATNRAGKITAPINYTLQNMIYSAKVSCRNGTTSDKAAPACPWIGKLSDWIEKHDHYQCDYVTVQCPFRGCDVSGTRREMKKHHDTCPHFVVRCPLRQDCDFYCVRQEMWKHVWFTEFGSLLVAVLVALVALALGYLVLPKIMYYGYLAGYFFAEMLYFAFHYL